MNTNIWLWIITGGVPGAIVASLLSPNIAEALRALAKARAQRVKHVPVDGAELYHNGVPLDEAQFRAAYAAYRAELDALPLPPDRDTWQQAQANAACQRLAVITGTHPNAFPSLGDLDEAYAWYKVNNRYATARLPRRHWFRLLPPGDVAID